MTTRGIIAVIATSALAIAPHSLVGAVGGAGATTMTQSAEPPAEAFADIPPVALAAYINAATDCPGLSWQLLAAIGMVESAHGRANRATITSDGRATPDIIGPPLDGTNATQRVDDTDNGALDHDTTYDHAVGPMQFLPATWNAVGIDANDDGVADINNLYDAAATAARFLCPDGSLEDPADALLRYNRSTLYVTEVLERAHTYTGTTSEQVTIRYSLPLPHAAIKTSDALTVARHDDRLLEIAVAANTPIYSITSGLVIAVDGGLRCGRLVILLGDDATTYTYCNLNADTAPTGARVSAGDLIATSFAEPETTSADNTSTPNLHLSVQHDGAAICPQRLLLAIYDNMPLPPPSVPACGYPRSVPLQLNPAMQTAQPACGGDQCATLNILSKTMTAAMSEPPPAPDHSREQYYPTACAAAPNEQTPVS